MKTTKVILPISFLGFSRMFLIACFLVSSLAALSQNWKLKDIGVGIVSADDQYDKELKIVKRGDEWNQKELYESGAFSGTGKIFSGWIVGPHSKEYLNSYGTPVWMYKYITTYPDGTKQEFGPYGFYTSGFGSFSINASSAKDIGKWKIDFYIVNRDTKETRNVGSVNFQMNSGEQLSKKKSSKWPVKDIGIGIYDDSEYDTKLKIVEKGDVWSQSKLYEQGYFAGRGKVFGSWIVGPPVDTYLNSSGVPIYNYKYTITYPNGEKAEFGPFGFYKPGFTTFLLPLYGGNCIGKIKIEYFIWNKEDQTTMSIGEREFTMNK